MTRRFLGVDTTVAFVNARAKMFRREETDATRHHLAATATLARAKAMVLEELARDLEQQAIVETWNS